MEMPGCIDVVKKELVLLSIKGTNLYTHANPEPEKICRTPNTKSYWNKLRTLKTN